MKKYLCLGLLLVMTVQLFGCAQLQGIEIPPLPDANQQTAGNESPAEKPAEQSVPESETQENYVLVKTAATSTTHMDPQNGTQPILIFSYESPSVYVGGRDDVTEKINEQLAHMDETYVTGLDYGFGEAYGENLLLEWATDHYTMLVNTDGGEMTAPYSSYRTVRTMRADNEVLSLLFTTSEYLGGVHGNYMDRAYMFDTQSGEYLTLEEITEDSEALRTFLTDYVLQLYEEDRDGYYSDRMPVEYLEPTETSVEDALAGLIRDGSWYFSREGLVLFSDLYELGPYAAGITEFVIPYEQLRPYIQERWIPQHGEAGGSLHLEELENISNGSIDVLDLITLDKDGQHICLIAEGTVRNVRISQVTYADHFYETAQLWSCSYMKDSMLQLDVMIPDGMPNLMISFDNEQGNRENYLLSQSGEDGSLLLIADDVQAVG